MPHFAGVTQHEASEKNYFYCFSCDTQWIGYNGKKEKYLWHVSHFSKCLALCQV
jgi:hypothetical protein